MRRIPAAAPYYDHAGITIYHGDAHDLFPGLPLPRGTVTVTDPPYGFHAYASDVAPEMEFLTWLLRQSPTVALFGYPEDLARFCATSGQSPDEWVTWYPTNKTTGRARLLPRSSECVAIFGRVPGAQRVTRPRSEDVTARRISEARGLNPDEAREHDVWRDPAPGMGFNGHLRQHPNEKPLTVMTRLVELCSEPDQVILDPFAGSGTTLVAAKALGRRAVGVEIEERYCEIAAKRLAQEVLPL